MTQRRTRSLGGILGIGDRHQERSDSSEQLRRRPCLPSSLLTAQCSPAGDAMQIFLTIVSGVAVYVLGQLVLHFVLEPIKAFNKEKGDTSFLLLRHRAIIANMSNTDEEIQG